MYIPPRVFPRADPLCNTEARVSGLLERRRILVGGIVQGVGFRPFVHALAVRLDLGGFVRNRSGGVEIEVEGPTDAVDRFVATLREEAPPLARIEGVRASAVPPRGASPFVIVESDSARRSAAFVAPDAATCQRCVDELFDPANRRHRYPFLSCSDCGPRLTIVVAAPYDRPRTSMAVFPMCDACAAEYEDPADRRHHAELIACAACGPRLAFSGPKERRRLGERALDAAVAALRVGKIVAVKGIGGYHLACDARASEGVERLRRRKHRDEKPFALLVGDADAAAELCRIDSTARRLLESSARPIVVLARRPDAPVAAAVAPGIATLGVMLPHSPLHHVLARDFGAPLVMTSGNGAHEPIAIDVEDARERLADVADAFLDHDRPITTRCDDSVVRATPGGAILVRRSRGYAPESIPLSRSCPAPILAVGGQGKVVFALGAEGYAIPSHHLGDLDDAATLGAFGEAIAHYERLFSICPQVVAHDLHPEYASTRYAVERASREGLGCVPVQHHHAHVAACLAENGAEGPAIGVAFDGSGFGADGTIWGGEFLLVDGAAMRRVAHLRRVALPGGDAVARQPWRAALAHLMDAREPLEAIASLAPPTEIRLVARMLERGVNAPLASSAGRLFDAVAAIARVRTRSRYEGQAAVELEGLAAGSAAHGSYPFEIGSGSTGAPLEIDTRPLVRAVAADVRAGTPVGDVARRFHATLVDAIVEVCRRLRPRLGVASVALSGGVFVNEHLAVELPPRLEREGFRVHRHRRLPPNDGGLAVGQIAVAAAAARAGHVTGIVV